MNLTPIISGICKYGNKAFNIARKYGPTFLVIGGSAAVAAGGFMACKATLKADAILDAHYEGRAKIDVSTAMTDADYIAKGLDPIKDRYTPADRRRDLLNLYGATAGQFFRLYWPSVSLIAAGFASIFGGFGMIQARYAVALDSIAGIDKKFADYRGRVIDKYGVDEDKYLAGDIKQTIDKETIEIDVIDSEGNEVKQKVSVLNEDSIDEEDFTFIFDASSEEWSDDSFLFNDNRLARLEETITADLQLHRRSHFYVNDACKALKLHKPGNKGYGNRSGHDYGWTDSPIIGEAGLKWEIIPFIYWFNDDDDSQMPMMIELPDTYGDAQEDMDRAEELENNRQLFVNTYINSGGRDCGYLIHFLVDTDERGIPREITTGLYK